MLHFLLARVGRQVELTSGCIIGSKCEVSSCEVLPENTIIYGSECHRRVAADKPPVSMNSSAENFYATIHNLHYFPLYSFDKQWNHVKTSQNINSCKQISRERILYNTAGS